MSSGEKTAGYFGNCLLVESIGGGRLEFVVVVSISVFSVFINSTVVVVILLPLIDVSFVVIDSSFFIIVVV